MMNREEAEKVVKETIEYANQEIKKKKKKYLKIFVAILGIIVLLTSVYLFVFEYETPVKYSKDMVNVIVPEDKGLITTFDEFDKLSYEEQDKFQREHPYICLYN